MHLTNTEGRKGGGEWSGGLREEGDKEESWSAVRPVRE